MIKNHYRLKFKIKKQNFKIKSKKNKSGFQLSLRYIKNQYKTKKYKLLLPYTRKKVIEQTNKKIAQNNMACHLYVETCLLTMKKNIHLT